MRLDDDELSGEKRDSRPSPMSVLLKNVNLKRQTKIQPPILP
jgi:hypothetical protein